MIVVCDYCKHAKLDPEDEIGAVYCEVLKERGEDCFIKDNVAFAKHNRDEKCHSFDWDDNMRNIVRDLAWLSNRYASIHFCGEKGES